MRFPARKRLADDAKHCEKMEPVPGVNVAIYVRGSEVEIRYVEASRSMLWSEAVKIDELHTAIKDAEKQGSSERAGALSAALRAVERACSDEQ